MPAFTHPIRGPRALGLDAERVEDLLGRVRHAVEHGPLPAVQVALARHGELAVYETIGAASNETRFNIYSCTKPLLASAVWKLMGEGMLDVARPVIAYVPELAGHGKDQVTVEQLLCHTAGFPQAPLGPPQWYERASRIEQMQAWHLDWEPGSRFVYHPTSAHWMLAEVIAQVSGCDYRDYANREILDVLGLKAFRLGVPAGQQSDIAELAHVGEPPSSEELTALFGSSVNWPDTEDTSMLVFNRPRAREVGVPGGGAVSNAAELALFYQSLLHNRAGLWDARVLADAVGRVRVDLPDPTTGVPANRGLGVVIAGSGPEAKYRGMGTTVSSSTFGHQGVGGQISWGDPRSGLSFALLTNGLDRNPIRSARFCAGANNRAGACVES